MDSHLATHTPVTFAIRLAIVCVAFMLCPPLQAQQPSTPAPDTVPGTRKVFEPAYVDKKVQACHDFYQYANGAWLDHDTIPPTYSSSGVMREMNERNQLVVRSVLEDAVQISATEPNTAQGKLGRFYASCMDSARAESLGFEPIRADLDRIGAIDSPRWLIDEIAGLQKIGVTALFDFSPRPDRRDTDHYIAWAGQGGLGMPDRDYYTRTDAASDSLRRSYVAHISRLFQLTGASPSQADGDARRVLALETELANASMTRDTMRDPNVLQHRMTVAEAIRLAPNIEWVEYFKVVGMTTPITYLNVSQPAFFKRASELIVSEPMEAWRAYLRFHLLETASPWLSTPFVQEHFAYSALYSGVKQMLSRWKRCARNADRQLGDALGQAYVKKVFSPEARAEATQLIEDVRQAFHNRIMKLEWMSDTTKEYAVEKLARMDVKVGYPEKWRDYRALRVTDSAFVRNVFLANSFVWGRIVNRPGKTVDRNEWDMTVPTVNAYYDSPKNEMAFPAGALAPPNFDPSGDLAANYGAFGGSWSGHEITHGFDNEGRRYDASGMLRNWWAARDSLEFNRQAQLLVDQFTAYIQVDTFHVNGRLTLGENIADLGGLLIGYDALEMALERTGRRETLYGYTPEQRFFLAYAQSWRSHFRPEALKNSLTVDPHAPDRWRANGPLMNMPAFAEAFNCKPGDPMVRPKDLIPTIW